MTIKLANGRHCEWKVAKIGVIGPGIVGMPMAALLANARIKIGTDNPASVIVVQRNYPTSGWKVDAINAGKSTIGGIEPELDRIVANAVAHGCLRATHNYAELSDADVILVCVQTDKKGNQPDYGPLFSALNDLVAALKKKSMSDRVRDKIPLIIFESTLAPTTMTTLIKEYFAGFGLVDGKDILLGNSPNRVMPGRLVARVTTADKIVAGLNPQTPKLIQMLYSHIVTRGKLLPTNSLTAEVVKTLENAYRDVRIAYSAEVVRYCDEIDIDFFDLRDKVNVRLTQFDSASLDPNAVPVGGMLVPTIGVGGHCLPKDGILLWWRRIESGENLSNSMILNARTINDESPAETIKLAERNLGTLDGRKIAFLGAAYRFNSEDTRNSPTFTLAKLLLDKNCQVTIHDPYVKKHDQNLIKLGLQVYFTRNLEQALNDAEIIILCTAHQFYLEMNGRLLQSASLKAILDGCNLFGKSDFSNRSLRYIGIGRGKNPAPVDFVDFIYQGFQIVEIAVANELHNLIEFFNERFVPDGFNRVQFEDVQKLAASCSTGCKIVNPGKIAKLPSYNRFKPRLVTFAEKANASTDFVNDSVKNTKVA